MTRTESGLAHVGQQTPLSQTLPILYKSNRFVVVNKPPGLPSHASRTSPRSVEDMFPQLSQRKDGPWLVHRLDQDTSGCQLIALRKQALIGAQRLFGQRSVRKIYWAVVDGRPSKDEGVCDGPLLRVEHGRQWRMTVDDLGAASQTVWRVIHRGREATLLELELLTGRTHQIRAHCAFMGHPVVGDSIYSGKVIPSSDSDALMLLSRSIALTYGDETVTATAPPSGQMARWLKGENWEDLRQAHAG